MARNKHKKSKAESKSNSNFTCLLSCDKHTGWQVIRKPRRIWRVPCS